MFLRGASFVHCEHLVRLGNRFDGGYVICESTLADCDFLLSFGISDDWSFEADYLKRTPKLRIHAYDHSIGIQYFIFQAFLAFVKFIFKKIDFHRLIFQITIPFKFYKFFRGNVIHHKYRVTNSMHNVDDVIVSKIFSTINSNQIFCKIDIEGSEYKIVEDLLLYSDKIFGLVVEFHEVDFLNDKFKRAIENLCKVFDIIHVHGNNFGFIFGEENTPDVIEISFSKKNRHLNSLTQISSPKYGIDYSNDPSLPDYSFTVYTDEK